MIVSFIVTFIVMETCDCMILFLDISESELACLITLSDYDL